MPIGTGRRRGRKAKVSTATSSSPKTHDVLLGKPASSSTNGATSKQYGGKTTTAPAAEGTTTGARSKQYGGKTTAAPAAEGTTDVVKVKPPHKIRKPRPPPFAELFIKAKENNKTDSLESDGFFKEAPRNCKGRGSGRVPLAPLVTPSLNSSSLCAPDDTFDKIFSKRCGPSTTLHKSTGISRMEDSCSTSDTASLDLPGALYASLNSQGPCSTNHSTDTSGPWYIPPSPPCRKPSFQQFSRKVRQAGHKLKTLSQDDRLMQPNIKLNDTSFESHKNEENETISPVIEKESISQDSLLDMDNKKSPGNVHNFIFKTPTALSRRTRNRSKYLGKLSANNRRSSQVPSTPKQQRPTKLTNPCLSGKLATVRTRRRLAALNRSRCQENKLLVQFSISGDNCQVLSVSRVNGSKQDHPNNDDGSSPDTAQTGTVFRSPEHVVPASVSGNEVFKFPVLPSRKHSGLRACSDHIALTQSSDSFSIPSKCSEPRDRLTSTPSQPLRVDQRRLLPSPSTPVTAIASSVSQLYRRLSPVRSDDHSSQHVRLRTSTLFESPMIDEPQQDDVFRESKVSCGHEAVSTNVENRPAGTEVKNRLRFSQDGSGDGSSSYNTATSTKWRSMSEAKSTSSPDLPVIPNLSGNSLQSVVNCKISPPLSRSSIEQLSRPCFVVLTDCIRANASSRLYDFKSPSLSSNIKSTTGNTPSINGDIRQMSITIKTTKSNKHTTTEVRTFIHPRSGTVAPDCADNLSMSRLTASIMQSSFFKEAMRCGFAPSPVITRRQALKRVSRVPLDQDSMESCGLQEEFNCKRRRRRNIRSILDVHEPPLNDQSAATEQNAVTEPRPPSVSVRRSRRLTRASYSSTRRILTRSQLKRSNASTTMGSVICDSDAETGTSKTKYVHDADSDSDLESSVGTMSQHEGAADDTVDDCIKKTARLRIGTSVRSDLHSIVELSLHSDEEHDDQDTEEMSFGDHKSSNSVDHNTVDCHDQDNESSLVAATTETGHSASSFDEEELAEAADQFAMPSVIELPTKRGKGWRRSLSSFGIPAANYSRTSLTSFRSSIVPSDCDRRQTAPGAISFKLGLPALATHNDGNSIMRWQRRSSILQHSIAMAPTAEQQQPDARRQVLDLCHQDDVLPVTRCFGHGEGCRKIGEGVYGEVFMVPAEGSRPAKVLKVMPIEGDQEVNGEPQKTFAEIVSEIIISVELSGLRDGRDHRSCNFVHVLKCWCVRGAYTDQMLQCWDQFHEEKVSENDRPDLFGPEQLYIVLEFGHGGRDLENYVFNNAGQALSVFWQVAHGLSVAESSLEFEHRDLHWGNVLVAPTTDTSEQYRLEGQEATVPLQGVRATIIDFTLSRLRCSSSVVVYNNLAADPSLFTATGDYQFDVYRGMKDANGNEWEKFEPRTNVLWLHYLVDKIISECYYKNVKSKVHKTNLAKLARLRDSVLQYDSARHLVAEEWQD